MHTDSGVSGEEDGSLAPRGMERIMCHRGIKSVCRYIEYRTVRKVRGRQLIVWNVDE